MEMQLVVLGPESQAVGSRKVQQAIASILEYDPPSVNDSTLLVGEIQRLGQQVKFVHIWDKTTVGDDVRALYRANEDRKKDIQTTSRLLLLMLGETGCVDFITTCVVQGLIFLSPKALKKRTTKRCCGSFTTK